MKAHQQFFPVALFITLYQAALTLSLWIKTCSVIIQMKAHQYYFTVALFVMLYKVALSLWMKSYSVTI